MKPLLFLCIVFHVVVSVVGQSRHPLKRTLFLDKYLAQKGYTYPLKGGFDAFLDLRPWSSDFKAGGQQMIRTDSNLYIFIESSGRLYKAVDKDSSNIYFQRIDSTLAMFYNIGSYQFTEGEDIYSFGGYGFWKSNGLLRKYNFKQGQWDVVPLDREVIAQHNPAPVVWYDQHQKKLCVPFQRIVNEGVIDHDNDYGDVQEDSWALDLSARKWIKSGTVNEKAREALTKINSNIFLLTSRGLMFQSQGKLMLIDFSRNILYLSDDDPTVQSYYRMLSDFDLSFQSGDMLYFWDSHKLKIDSLPVQKVFNTTITPIIDEFNINLRYLGGGLFLGLIVLLTYGFKWKKKLMQQPKGDDVNAKEQIQLGPEINLEQFEHKFTATELDLIRLCLERSMDGVYANLEDVNHVLGIKNKSKGLQKKVRSEVINSINLKFKEIDNGCPRLIESIRNEQDKRYFDYYIESKYQKTINFILHSLQ